MTGGNVTDSPAVYVERTSTNRFGDSVANLYFPREAEPTSD